VATDVRRHVLGVNQKIDNWDWKLCIIMCISTIANPCPLYYGLHYLSFSQTHHMGTLFSNILVKLII
jgi:hypothetical protein